MSSEETIFKLPIPILYFIMICPKCNEATEATTNGFKIFGGRKEGYLTIKCSKCGHKQVDEADIERIKRL